MAGRSTARRADHRGCEKYRRLSVRTIATMLLTTSMAMAMSSGARRALRRARPDPSSRHTRSAIAGIECGHAHVRAFTRRRQRPLHVRDTRGSERTRAPGGERRRESSAASSRSTPTACGRWSGSLDDGKSGDKGDGVLQFDWAQGAATGRIEGEPGRTCRRSRSCRIACRFRSPSSTALLRGEEPGEIPLIDDNRVKRYTYTRKETHGAGLEARDRSTQ